MILVDKPYVSDFVRETSKNFNLPIVDTPAARELGLDGNDPLMNEADATSWLRANPDARIYTTSENAIGWIAEHLAFTNLPEKIEVFKNKTKFRELIRPMLPDFFFQEVPFGELDSLKVDELPIPFVVKPNIGFFSLGVHKVNRADEWEAAKAALQAEVKKRDEIYPEEVLDTTTFIIEEMVAGEEFAFDAYFDENAAPVLLDIYHHPFSSADDVGDRIYTTSAKIIRENLADFSNWLGEIGKLADVRNFPVHVEVRRTADGKIVPIEVNPLRFGGWCTTADVTAAAYGFNPYVYYFENKRPNWEEIFATREGLLYSLIILDNSTGCNAEEIKAFDYKRLLASFENPLELRKLDYQKFPVFGFLFTQTRQENFAELERILKSDLKEYVRC